MTKRELKEAINKLYEELNIGQLFQSLEELFLMSDKTRAEIIDSISISRHRYLEYKDSEPYKTILEIILKGSVYDMHYHSLLSSIVKANDEAKLHADIRFMEFKKSVIALHGTKEILDATLGAADDEAKEEVIVFVILSDQDDIPSVEFSRAVAYIAEIAELYSNAIGNKEQPRITAIDSGSPIEITVYVGVTLGLITSFITMWKFFESIKVRRAKNEAEIAKANADKMRTEQAQFLSQLDFVAEIKARAEKDEITDEEAENYIARISKTMENCIDNGIVPIALLQEEQEVSRQELVLEHKRQQMLLNSPNTAID